jgi:hypothetical protein
MDVPYDKSAGQPICTHRARRGRHMDVPYESLTLIPAYNIASLTEVHSGNVLRHRPLQSNPGNQANLQRFPKYLRNVPSPYLTRSGAPFPREPYVGLSNT